MSLNLLTYGDVEGIFAEVAPENVPEEFIEAVAISTRSGGQYFVSGSDFIQQLKQDRATGTNNIMEARMLIKVDRARMAAHKLTRKILTEIEQRDTFDDDSTGDIEG